MRLMKKDDLVLYVDTALKDLMIAGIIEIVEELEHSVEGKTHFHLTCSELIVCIF